MSDAHTHTIDTPHDSLPDFGAHPTATPRSLVGWSSLAVWGGRLPGGGDTVAVPDGVTVVYDHYAGAPVRALAVKRGGALHLMGGSRLVVTDFIVEEGARLQIDAGAEVILAPGAFRADDPKQYGCGLLCLGSCVVRGTPKTHRARLARAPRPGDTELLFETAPSGWRAGDRLAVPQYYPGFWWERKTLASVVVRVQSVSGARVLLAYPYEGRLESAGFLPYVANLTRDAVIRSADGSGLRGHVQFLHRAGVDLRHVALVGLGRTTPETGQQIGRYALHLHHLTTPFRAEGVVIEDSRKWGLAAHDCHAGEVIDTVCRGAQHACFATEDGSESNLTFRGNVALDAKWGQPSVVNPNDLGGYGFWPNGRENCRFENNAAYNCRWAWWVPGLEAPPSRWATFQGNEDGGCEGGVYLDHTRTHGHPQDLDDHRSTTHCSFDATGISVLPYNTDGVNVRRLKAWNACFQAYSDTGPIRLEDCQISDPLHAILDNSQVMRSLVAIRCHLDAPVGILVNLAASVGAGPLPDAGVAQKSLRLERCTSPGVLLELTGTPDGSPSLVPCLPHRAVVVDAAGRSWVCYRDGSAPNAICPWVGQTPDDGSGWPRYACPEPGLTNAQSWARFGVAFAGAIIPPGAGRVPWLSGGVVAAVPPGGSS